MHPISPRRGHAVVIGASMGGLLAARALSESFERVTVLDRDELPTEPSPRRGVPQGRHPHALLARGREVLDEFFPGLSDELLAAGVPLIDVRSDFHWYADGRLLCPGPSGLFALGVSRPLLEFAVGSRVAALPRVSIVDRCEVTGLTSSPDRRRITGVRMRNRSADAAESVLAADLVVDAAGRGTRGPVWLDELGYARAPEERVRIDVTYLSRLYRREPHHLGGRLGSTFAPYPGQLRSGLVLGQEGERFMVNISAWGGDEVLPTEDAGMAEFAEHLAAPDIAEIIRSADPLSEPVLSRYPASVRRRYEQLDRFPEAYLVAADALCSFNPIYGQGMTVAALEAQLLGRLLHEGGDELWLRFFTASATLLDNPWGIVVGGDLRFPHVEGERTAEMLEMGEYLERYREAAEDDAVLATALLRVINMLDGPERLVAPELQERVLRGAGPARAAVG
ncbi:FAD-dependent oxidoreductase [Pseudonocardia xinjiangensis]|uniref:FAD-dependent oxidoreductase n=1 Tax=Pseudonocardia xinjiangensis TaxID=75289 RepID=UPI003D8E8307